MLFLSHLRSVLAAWLARVFACPPKADWNKGKAVTYLLKKLHIDDSCTVPVFIGDDTTDEDAFAAIADCGIGILVAEHDQETAARYVLRDPDEVTVFLELLVTLAEIQAWR